MADTLKVWFDREADYLEVRFSDAPGYMKATDNDALMQRVDASGNVLGFSILGVSLMKGNPLSADISLAHISLI